MTRECIKMDHKIASHNTFIIEYRECVIIKKNLQKDFKNYQNVDMGKYVDRKLNDDETGLRNSSENIEI